MKVPPNGPCVCGSGAKFKRCCRPWLDGQPPPTPEALMRSRYAAYALGRVGHIVRTTHPEGPHWQHDVKAWRQEIAAFCESATFERLEVVDARTEGDRGMVAFHAHLRGPDGAVLLSERSAFLRMQGRWLYHSGVRLPPPDGDP